MKTNKFYLMTIILIVFTALTFKLTLASVSYAGSLHQHTGYSTGWGYDGNGFTFGDDCTPRILEGHLSGGYTVAELKEQTLAQNIDWLSFTDHIYCINSSEFNTVKSDCQNIQTDAFTCLWGEEVSADGIVKDIEMIPRGFVALGIIVYLNEKEAI